MPGERQTFGRVDVMVALLELLGAAPALAGVQVEYSWPGETGTQDEAVFFGEVTGEVTQGPYRGTSAPTTDDDKFVIPVHVHARNTADQATALDALRRCQELTTAVRQTVAAKKTLDDVPGLLFVALAGFDGPFPVPLGDPVGWVAYATVRVSAWIRMT